MPKLLNLFETESRFVTIYKSLYVTVSLINYSHNQRLVIKSCLNYTIFVY